MSYRDEVLFEFQPEPEIPFSVDEFQQRLRRIRERMAQDSIDCLFLTSPESMYYVSGYRCMWYQAQSAKVWPATSGVAVHVDHPRFILFDTEREAALARTFTVSEDTRVFPRSSLRDGSQFIVDELAAEGWLNGSVGLEYWSYRPNRAISERFERRFRDAGVRVVDGSNVLREVRWVKSPAERQCLREAARIADVGLGAVRDALRPGATELEVFGAAVQAMAAAGGENPAMTMPVLSGGKANCAHALATRRIMQPNEIVLVDVCGVYQRYHINMARTYSLGEPGGDVRDLADRAAGSMQVLRDVIRPHVAVATVTDALRSYYQEQGLWDHRGWLGGYEMGIAFPPDWAGNFVFDLNTPLNAEHELLPGVALNYENQFFLPGHVGMYFMIESMLFEEDGATLLSNTPYELTVVE